MHEDMRKLVEICHVNLENSEKCKEYLHTERGLTDEIIEKFQLGYFPRNIQTLTNHVSADLLRRISVLDYSGKSKFSDFFFLTFPIQSEYNEPVGLGGRTLLSEFDRKALNLPKYKNSSFRKANYLYGLNTARSHIMRDKCVYIVEGYFDCIALYAAGVKNVVAVCGTAFSKQHMLKLARYTDKFCFLLDNDEAGQKSMKNIYNKYVNKGIKMRFISLPKSVKDIDQYFDIGGTGESFYQLDSFVPGIDFS